VAAFQFITTLPPPPVIDIPFKTGFKLLKPTYTNESGLYCKVMIALATPFIARLLTGILTVSPIQELTWGNPTPGFTKRRTVLEKTLEQLVNTTRYRELSKLEGAFVMLNVEEFTPL
jgi:hypothetical protein